MQHDPAQRGQLAMHFSPSDPKARGPMLLFVWRFVWRSRRIPGYVRTAPHAHVAAAAPLSRFPDRHFPRVHPDMRSINPCTWHSVERVRRFSQSHWDSASRWARCLTLAIFASRSWLWISAPSTRPLPTWAVCTDGWLRSVHVLAPFLGIQGIV